MARYTGPKDKLSRREGHDLFGKGEKLRRLNVPPGEHGRRGRRKSSTYASQLREKQKAKRIYGVNERQFANYVKSAIKTSANSFEILFQRLELRLDNAVFRLGFAKTRPFARQLISHGHIAVNSKKLNIPSHRVKVDDVITLKTKVQNNAQIIEQMEKSKDRLVSWVERKGPAGRIIAKPAPQDGMKEIDWQKIIGFYTR